MMDLGKQVQKYVPGCAEVGQLVEYLMNLDMTIIEKEDYESYVHDWVEGNLQHSKEQTDTEEHSKVQTGTEEHSKVQTGTENHMYSDTEEQSGEQSDDENHSDTEEQSGEQSDDEDEGEMLSQDAAWAVVLAQFKGPAASTCSSRSNPIMHLLTNTSDVDEGDTARHGAWR